MASPTVLLTGSSRGIGRAIAEALRARGARVIGHASSIGDEETIAADFSDPIGPQLLWHEAIGRAGGRIDVLINNAGIFAANPLDGSDIAWLDAWEDTMRINLTSAAQLSRFAIQNWRERRSDGRIVHIASRAGHRGDSPGHWHYAASKGAMIALHKTIARAYAADGILSFTVAPGFTDTAPNDSGADDYLASRGGPGLLADIPLGRVAEPGEIAAIAVFCALDAPASMTGAVIDANGASYVR
jgi:NAD(P)-dependent dehydrogenase (short-subunit alcohol dehydrogenase family)